MALVKVKPTSNGRRAVVKLVNPDLHKGTSVPALTEKKNRKSGRNNAGRTRQLRTLAREHLDAMNGGTHRNIPERQCIAGLDRCFHAGQELGAH